jgi:hypothetical protein
MRDIIVRVRDVYGQRKVYPVCSDAKLFAEIAGTTTLTDNTLRRIRDLGFDIKIQQEELL